MYIGNGHLNYTCFCSADSGTYYFTKYLSHTVGMRHDEKLTIDGGLQWTTRTSIDGTVISGYLGCYHDKKHNIIYRFKYSNTAGGESLEYSVNCGHSWNSYGTFSSWAWLTLQTHQIFSPADENNCYLFGGNQLIRLTKNFSRTVVDSNYTYFPKLLFFTDLMNGYLVASRTSSSNCCDVYKTIDGGSHFNIVYSDTNKNYNCMYFITSDLGFIAGSNGAVIKTTDGGATWQDVSTGDSNNIILIDFYNDSIGILASDSGLAMITYTGGQDWIPENTGIQMPISRIYCFSDSIFYATTICCGYKKQFPLADSVMASKDDLVVSPNPSQNLITIECPSVIPADIAVAVFSIQGKLIMQRPLNPDKTIIDISNLSDGVYILKISGEGFNVVRKIVKE